MRTLSRIWILFALILGLAACAPWDSTSIKEESPIREEESTENEPQPEVVEFEASIEEMIEIEGMKEPIVLKLYDNPDAPFITYVPEDLIVEEASGGEGESYKFHANYEDERLEDIFLEIYFFA